MVPRYPFTQKYQQLPDAIPVFPLENAVVLPGGELPLNIFEQRYLGMVVDAMKTHHLIGMIQPRDEAKVPALERVGCAGRIVRFAETTDGRLEIVLAGVCRFSVAGELATTRGYRMVRPDWFGFAHDFAEEEVPDEMLVAMFEAALRGYFDRNDMQMEWAVMDRIGPLQLVHNLVSVLPLGRDNKQLLLETPDAGQLLRQFTLMLEDTTASPAVTH